ncbi:MAG TPA: flagellar M-ring protein FliF C-terminal domain-containing protein, partial [Capillimicrobium sp.]
PDKAQVQVNPTLNVDKTSIEELDYGKGTPIEVTEESEALEGSGAGGGAAAGAAPNMPGYAGGGGGGAGGESNYDNQASSQKFAIDKTVTRREVAPGTVESLDVALMLDKTIPRADVAGIRDAVASAAGIDNGRGDTLSVTQLAFAKPPEAAKPLMPTDGILGYAKYALLGVASLLFLFFITRHLRRRENEELVSPTWLRQLDAPMPIAQLATADVPSLATGSSPRRQQVDEVVKKEPERVATALRTWMNEGQ